MIRSILTVLIFIAFTSLFIYALHVNHRNQPGNGNISELSRPKSGKGSISGRIVDSNGNPIARERVYAVSEKYGDANRPGAYSIRTASAPTDNQGNYRIQELAPGNYIVSIGPSPEGEVNSSPGKQSYYVKRYYPNTYSKENAKIIEISDGSEITGINITAGEMKNTVEIRGQVVNADTGQPIAGITIGYSVVPRSEATSVGTGPVARAVVIASSFSAMPGRRSSENGEFLITGVFPGKYYIMPGRQLDQNTEYYAEPTESEVADQGVIGLIVKMRRGITISGKVEIQGAKDPETLSKVKEMQVTATSRFNQFDQFMYDSNRTATISPDGAFTLKGMRPGKVSINLNSLSQGGAVFQLDRIEYKGVSIGREGIEVREGENPTGVRLIAVYGSITVRGSVKINGNLPEGMKLRVVAVRQGDYSSNKLADLDPQGNFVITNLSAGEYIFRVLPMMTPPSGEDRKIILEAIHRAAQTVVVSENNQQPIVLTVNLN